MNGYLIVDGALGTELERRGYPCPAPCWSAFEIRERRSVLQDIYAAYIEAGARVLTSNTYRTTSYSYQKAGILEAESRAKEDTFFAVELIRDLLKTSSVECLIAGSLAPLEDCLSPSLTPDESVLKRHHQQNIIALHEAGVDYIATESIGSMKELKVICALCEDQDIALALSVRLLHDNRLVDASIEEFFEFIKSKDLVYAGFNCMPLHQCKKLLESYRLPKEIEFLLSPNGEIFEENRVQAERKNNYEELFLEVQQGAQKKGCKVFGGCCGTNARYINSLSKMLARE